MAGNGTVSIGFEQVQEAFKANFSDGWEELGAAFAVYYEDKLIVDLYDGYTDLNHEKEWKTHTLTPSFSASKAISALCVAKLVDQGHVDYNDLVTKYWPEFGQNGKEGVTVAMLVSHEAGLAGFTQDLRPDDLTDSTKASLLFEQQEPLWQPGTAWGYHLYNYWQLIDQFVRRADPKHRSVAQFFNEEIKDTEELYMDARPDWARTTEISYAGFWNTLAQIFHNPWLLIFYIRFALLYITKWNKTFNAVFSNVKDLYQQKDIIETDLRFTGLCTARGLAQPFAQLITGQNGRLPPLLKETTIATISKPRWQNEPDLVLGITVPQGYGFRHAITPHGRHLIGHSGYGGQNVKFDLYYKVAFAYVTNSLKVRLGENCRTMDRLVNALYDCLGRIESMKNASHQHKLNKALLHTNTPLTPFERQQRKESRKASKKQLRDNKEKKRIENKMKNLEEKRIKTQIQKENIKIKREEYLLNENPTPPIDINKFQLYNETKEEYQKRISAVKQIKKDEQEFKKSQKAEKKITKQMKNNKWKVDRCVNRSKLVKVMAKEQEKLDNKSETSSSSSIAETSTEPSDSRLKLRLKIKPDF